MLMAGCFAAAVVNRFWIFRVSADAPNYCDA